MGSTSGLTAGYYQEELSENIQVDNPSRRRHTGPSLTASVYTPQPIVPLYPYYPHFWQYGEQAKVDYNSPDPKGLDTTGTHQPRPSRGGGQHSRSPKQKRLHGHSTNTNSGRGGKALITRESTSTMPSRQDEAFTQKLPARPSFQSYRSSTSHQPASVPSTPHQHVRKLSFGSKSTSPEGRTPNHSPRSAHSDSNSSLPPLRAPPGNRCKFETGMAYSRRRMPYSIGAEKLERAKGSQKKQLNPKEEEKLSGDMRELYDRLLPSTESEERRARFVQKLEKLLNDRWPGNNIKVHVFGSSGNLLCTSDSDVDICITTPMKELENVCLLAKALADYGMERVVCVPQAKVPIVKIWDPELQLACDMNVNNTLALENTRMIKAYVEIDDRVRPLAMIIKHWTKRRILNDAALGGTLSSYTWICMILNFLQTRSPPILPVLHQRPHQQRAIVNGVQSSFADDVDSLRGLGKGNKETLGELLFHFFRRYGHEIDYEKIVVSVRQGKLISKEEKGWHLMQNNRLCVEEPFNTTRNLGNTADDTAFRGLHMEIRRAFSLIADAVDLAGCCEQYVFPVEEERIWAKPPPQPRPVLSRSTSQSGKSARGGTANMRGGKYHHAQHHRTVQSNRRASSAASLGHANHGAPQTAPLTREYLVQAQRAQSQLHEQLYQHYQLLQVQENELRWQLIQQAHAQAQSMAHAYARNQNLDRSTNGHPSPRLASLDNPPLTAPMRPELYLYPLQYSQMPIYAQQGTSTNPSSPSLTPATPELRRSLHRSSAAHASSSASFRSHSQPARSVPAPLALQGFSASNFGSNGLPGYHHARQNPPSHPPAKTGGHFNPVSEANNNISPAELAPEDSVPKEYVGYHFGGSPSIRPYRPDLTLQPIPAFSDIARRRVAAPLEQLPPPVLDRLRRDQRSPSPSPLGRETDYPAALKSAPLATEYPRQRNPLSSSHHQLMEDRGPLIVDGSRPSVSKIDPIQSVSMNMSASTSASDDHSFDTPATMFDSLSQDHFESAHVGSTKQPLYSQHLLELHKQTEDARTDSVASTPAPSSSGTVTAPQAWSPPTQSSPSAGATNLSHLGLRVDDTGNVSPRSSPNMRQRASRRVSLLPVGGVPPLDITKTTRELSAESASNGLPLLSPVPETRTPSPSANRKSDTSKVQRPNGIISPSENKTKDSRPVPTQTSVNGKQPQTEALMKKPNGTASNGTIKGNANGAGGQGSWQKTTRKRARSNASKKSANQAKSQAEPLPEKESERKGG
ncbi:MAG: hypothetical protein M1812_003395 [Candelaria pacifica]|nr:MAG: hypothetical protein M1812_003395 [Candelaria pacifica]